MRWTLEPCLSKILIWLTSESFWNFIQNTPLRTGKPSPLASEPSSGVFWMKFQNDSLVKIKILVNQMYS